ncbi:MAG: hypothetical protein JST28_20245 [Acidobacteria bacterium]|nr:hypothetical protein [Acidobacteriota bacterium]
MASTAPHEKPDEFDDFIRPYVASDNFSGNVLIEHHGKIVFQRSYGYAQREQKQFNNGNTPLSHRVYVRAVHLCGNSFPSSATRSSTWKQRWKICSLALLALTR